MRPLLFAIITAVVTALSLILVTKIEPSPDTMRLFVIGLITAIATGIALTLAARKGASKRDEIIPGMEDNDD